MSTASKMWNVSKWCCGIWRTCQRSTETLNRNFILHSFIIQANLFVFVFMFSLSLLLCERIFFSRFIFDGSSTFSDILGDFMVEQRGRKIWFFFILFWVYTNFVKSNHFGSFVFGRGLFLGAKPVGFFIHIYCITVYLGKCLSGKYSLIFPLFVLFTHTHHKFMANIEASRKHSTHFDIHTIW